MLLFIDENVIWNMDFKKRLLLQRHRDAIVKDLDVNDIIDELLAKNVLPVDEIERMIILVWYRTLCYANEPL